MEAKLFHGLAGGLAFCGLDQAVHPTSAIPGGWVTSDASKLWG
jgi:hypothetical protein